MFAWHLEYIEKIIVESTWLWRTAVFVLLLWYMLCGNVTHVCCGDSPLTPAPLCLSLSACPHRSTLPKSGHRKYGPPSVQLAHDLTLWQLDFHSFYCVSVCVPFRKTCVLIFGLMCFFFVFFQVLLTEEKAWRTFVSTVSFLQIIYPCGFQTKVNSHTLDMWLLQGETPWSSLRSPKEKGSHWWPRAQSGRQQ